MSRLKSCLLGIVLGVAYVGESALLLAQQSRIPQEWIAALGRNLSRAEFATLLGPSPDVHAIDGSGRTIAYHTAKAERWDLVEELFARGYDPRSKVPLLHYPNLTRHRGVEILTEAARQGKLIWVRKLLETGVSPDTGQYNTTFQDALGLALAYDRREIAMLLLRNGAPRDRQIGLPANDLPGTLGTAGNRSVLGTGVYANNRPIHLAAMHKNAEILSILLEEGAEVNAKNSNGMTAIALAAAAGWLPGVELLLMRGADRTVEDVNRDMPFDHARPFPEIRQTLLRQKFGVKNSQDVPPGIRLLLAVDLEDLETIRGLLDSPAARTFVDQNGMSAVMFAAGWRRPSVLPLLAEKGMDLNLVSVAGHSALTLALTYNHEDVAKLLLDLGADPNACDPRRVAPPIELAVAMKMVPLANELLDKGARPVGSSSKEGFSAPPLHRAAALGELELVLRLLEKGADVRALDSQGYGALMHACMANVPEIVQLLVERGLDPNQTYSDGQTPLSMAVRKKNVAIVRVLLKMGAKPDQLKFMGQVGTTADDAAMKEIFALLYSKHGDAYKVQAFWASRPDREKIMAFVQEGGDPDAEGFAEPLQEAIWKGDYSLAQFLLKHGADPDGRGASRPSPLTLAGYNSGNKDDEELIELARNLLRMGADPNHAGRGLSAASTPLEAAIRSGGVSLVELLLKNGARTAEGWKALEKMEGTLKPDIADRIRESLTKAAMPRRMTV